MKKLVVGLTGILGSGKSAAAHQLRELGACLVDMDLAGRWAVEQNAHVQQQLRATFGDFLFDAHNNLDRKKLGDIVFRDASALQQLNEIVHPAMLERVRALVEQAQQSGDCPYIVVDAALIFELGFEPACDLVATVTAPLAMCLERARRFKHLTEQQALDRINSQLPQEEKTRRADYVIHNDSTLADLQEQTKKLHLWLLTKTIR